MVVGAGRLPLAIEEVGGGVAVRPVVGGGTARRWGPRLGLVWPTSGAGGASLLGGGGGGCRVTVGGGGGRGSPREEVVARRKMREVGRGNAARGTRRRWVTQWP
jgi:hypothetical protein